MGGGTNVVTFARVTNVVSNPRYAGWEGSGGLGVHCKHPEWGPVIKPLEANAYNGFKQSRNLDFDTFFHVFNQLFHPEAVTAVIFGLY